MTNWTHLAAASAMSIGWALRGSIGGGPLGAMIPGALWAMVVAWRWGVTSRQASLLVGLSALAVGIGGQMTYGQTIGLVREIDTRAWGLLGLSLKGGIWGLSSATIMYLALARPRTAPRLMAVSLATCHLAWSWINLPKLIYFSNPVVKPREEIWAGLLAAALTLLIALPQRHNWLLAGAGFVGGAIGFGAGSLWNLTPINGFPGWKMMEFSFGFVLGGALSWGMERIGAKDSLLESAPLKRWEIAIIPVAALLVIAGDFGLPMRYAFSVVVAVLAPLLVWRPQWGWAVGFAATMAAACLDLYAIYPKTAIAFATAPAALVCRWQFTEERFNGRAAALLLGCCCAIYALEYWFNPMPRGLPK